MCILVGSMSLLLKQKYEVIHIDNFNFLVARLKKIKRNKRDTDVQNSLMDSVGEGEGGKIWENGIETCKISCMK